MAEMKIGVKDRDGALAKADENVKTMQDFTDPAELYQELVERGGTLRWDRDGFVIDSQARFSGYSFFGSDALFAEEGQKQSYFVECTMQNFT